RSPSSRRRAAAAAARPRPPRESVRRTTQTLRPSEARQLRVRELAAAHVHAAEFSATRECRHGFAGIEQALRVERALERVEHFELLAAELHAHLVDLLHADAVLAGDRSADRDAFLQYLGGELLGPRQLAGIVRVEQD